MPKPIPKRSEPFDIFGDERLRAAMREATAAVPQTTHSASEAPARPGEADEELATGTGAQPTTNEEPGREKETRSPRLGSSERAAKTSEEPATRSGAKATTEVETVREKRTRPAMASPLAVVPEGHVPLKFEVPPSMRAEFQAFRAELGAALGGIALDNSNIGRALLARLLGPDRARILDAARRSGALRRPRNDDSAAMAAFDAAVRKLLWDGDCLCGALAARGLGCIQRDFRPSAALAHLSESRIAFIAAPIG